MFDPIHEIEFPILGLITILTVLSFELCELWVCELVNWFVILPVRMKHELVWREENCTKYTFNTFSSKH